MDGVGRRIVVGIAGDIGVRHHIMLTQAGQDVAPQSVLDRTMRRVRLAAIAILAALALTAFAMPMVGRVLAMEPTPTMLSQDLALLPLLALAILFFAPGRPLTLRWSRWWWIAALVAIVAVGILGHRSVFEGVDLSRDEQMATFDAAIYRSGHLAQPIPAMWRPFTPALNLLFILPIGDHAAWVSSYLPVNASLRAIVGMVTDPAATSPLLVGIGFIALVAIARRLWPISRGAQAAALLCYVCSSQILMTGMTAFAMSAHLALNLVWLWLFLRSDKAGFVGTLAVAFLATGAHQPLFHPLFALPFLLELAVVRRWRRLAGYSVGYALILAFWIMWPVWMSRQGGAVPIANDREGIDYATRLLRQLALIDVGAVWTMAANLIRFVTWQHLLLLPLTLLGIGGWRRWPLVRPLAIGLMLPVAVMGLVLPWQGHGWGYRYLHPVLGNACLLAGYGWYRAETMRANLTRPMAWASLASLAVLLPVHGRAAQKMAEAQAVPERRIAALPADLAVIDSGPFAVNLVRNAPDLSERPIRLDGGALHPADIVALCRGRVIAFFDAPRFNPLYLYYHRTPATRPTPHQQDLRAAAGAAGCRVISS